jgi:cytidine deaminase
VKAKRSARRARRAPAPGPTAALVALAADARRKAHAPYSKFKVGAALLLSSGEIVTGCNIENASYGLTLCAERTAVFKAVSEGFRDFEAIAVVAESDRPTAPCGPCRQILWEFCGDIWVHIARPGRKAKSYRMSELLPVPFDDRHL